MAAGAAVLQRRHDRVRLRIFLKVLQHQHRREQQRRRVGDVAPGDVRRRAVHRLEHAHAVLAQIRRRHHAQAADQPRAQVRHDVAVQVRQQQHIEPLGVHHQVHAGGIDDAIVELDVGVARGHRSRAVEEQAVAELHDVGLVHRGHPLAPAAPRLLEGNTAIRVDASSVMIFMLSTTPGHHHVLEAGVEILGVFADDDEVDVLEARRHRRQVPHRPQVGVEVQRLAQPTLTLVNPLPTGVVIGPLSAILLRVMDASSSGGSVVPCSSTASAPALNVSHSGVNPAASRSRTTARVTSGQSRRRESA